MNKMMAPSCRHARSVRALSGQPICGTFYVHGVVGQLPVGAHPHNENGPERNHPASPHQPALPIRFTYWNINSIHVFVSFGALWCGPSEQCGPVESGSGTPLGHCDSNRIAGALYAKTLATAPATLDKLSVRRVQDSSMYPQVRMKIPAYSEGGTPMDHHG